MPPNVVGACVQCHSFARIGLQRRTPEMWKRLPDLHEYFVPFVASDTSSAGNLIDPWRQVATGEAIPYFAKRFPFQTAAWKEWQAGPPSRTTPENGWWSATTQPRAETTRGS